MGRRVEQERTRFDRLEAFYWTVRLKTEEKAGIELNLDAGTIRKRNLKLEKAWGKLLLKRYGKLRPSEPTDLGKEVFQIAQIYVEAAAQARKQTLSTRLQQTLNEQSSKTLPENVLKLLKALQPPPPPNLGITLGYKRTRITKNKTDKKKGNKR